jgi:hypothetical protein
MPLAVSMWYWHSPFRIEASEAAQLKSIGVTEMFVLDATVHASEGAPQLTMRQKWRSRANRLAIHLTFRFDQSAIGLFKQIEPREIVPRLAALIDEEVSRARKGGINVVGAQLDLDCPTRLLPRYAELIRGLRKRLTQPVVLSATALESWYASDSLQPLADAADFLVPQCYEASAGRSLSEFHPISNVDGIARVCERAPRFGRPFQIGLPVYGHAVVFDQLGRPAGMFRDMDARQALRTPSLKLQRAFTADRAGKPADNPQTSVGEELLDFQAQEPDNYGRGDGFHVVYLNPTADMLRRSLEEVAKRRPADCRGVVLFRFPEPGEQATLPLRTVRAVVQGVPASPQFTLDHTLKREPWDAIEGSEAPEGIQSAYKLRIRNLGEASTSVRPDALEVTLRLDEPGLETLDASDFDEVTPGIEVGEGSLKPSSLMRANVVRLVRYHCAAGETIGTVLIRPSSRACRVSSTWKAVACGQSYSGVFPTVGGAK